MNITDIITFELLSYYDSKLKEWINNNYYNKTTDSVSSYRGQVESYENLPTENLKIGDIYDVADTGNNYIWNGTDWDSTTKESADYEFATKEQIESLFD